MLLDTSILVAAEREGVVLDAVLGDDDEPAIAAITVAELRVGVLLASGQRRAARRRYVDGLLELLTVVPYDAAVAEAHAELLAAVRRTGRPRGAHDLLIAATARATGRPVVTSDVSGFDDLPGVAVRHLGP